MAQNNTAMAQSHNITISEPGQLHVPAAVQRELGGCYGQTLEVEVETPNGPTTSVTFEQTVNSGSNVTIPAPIRHMANLSNPDEVEVGFSLPEPDLPGDELSEASDDDVEEAVEEEEEDVDELLSDLFADEESEAEDSEEEEEEEGLGELFA